MELREVMASLQLDGHEEVLAPDWGASQASLPRREVFFLEPSYVTDACGYVGVPHVASDAAVAAAHAVAADPALTALAWHFHHCLYCSASYPRSSIGRWPSLADALPTEHGLFYLLVVLSGVPSVQSIYQERSIPHPVAAATLGDVERWMAEHMRVHGYWGLQPPNVGWLANHFRGEIFHLGRLQFQLGSFRAPLRAFRHRQSRAVLALSGAGVRYRGDGQMDGAGGVTDATGAWESRFDERGEGWLGNPISVQGCASPGEVWLPREEWQQVLGPAYPVLQLHIPAGSKLDFRLCGESFAAAMLFFPRHFPEFRPSAFACSSWLLDSQLETLLPPGSNLVRFLRELYLFPVRSDGREGLRRVFGAVPADLTQAPRDTTLRRALIDHLVGGGHLRGGGAFLLPDDLSWGQQVYRRQSPFV